MSGISTHVLDTTSGKPAANIRVVLFHEDRKISSSQTDANGRCQALLPSGVPLQIGRYRLIFETASHFPESFYPEVTVAFVVHDDSSHYHVPLLISPFGYTTYRGS